MTRFAYPTRAIAGLMLASALCAPAMAQDGHLRAALNADIRSTDPGVNRDANSDMLVSHVLEGLVAYAGDTTVVPMLAEAIDVSDDGKTYTFTLREGLTFHNGAPVTAEDFVASWTRYLNPDLKWRCLGDFSGGITKITSVTAPDAKTVVFELEKPAALFLASMARIDCGQGGVYHQDSLNADGTWNAPIGTGPYKLVKWEPGQYIDLEKFDGYAALDGGLNGMAGNKGMGPQTIRMQLIPDSAATRAALLAGDIDMIPDIDSQRDADELASRGLTVSRAGTLSVSGILFQTRDPVLQDSRVRRAIAMSIDNAELVKAVGGDAVSYNPSPIPQISGYHSDLQDQGYPYDPEAAQKLLAEAGYKGEEIVILTNTGYKSMHDTAVLAQAMLEGAGLNVRFEVMDWATQLDRYASGAYQMQAFSYSARYEPSLSFDMFMGDKDKSPNKIWDKPEALALLAASKQELDQGKRQEILDQLFTMMIADTPAIWQYNGQALAVLGPKVESFEAWGTSAPRYWTAKLK